MFSCFDVIYYYFNLDSFSTVTNFIKTNLIEENSNKGSIKDKFKTIIRFFSKDYTKTDKNFWSCYGITKKNLIEDGVKSVSYYIIIKELSEDIIKPDTPTYSLGDFNKRVKLYRPYNSKKYRFLSTTVPNDIGGLHNINYNTNYIVITKSYKDYRVLKNENLNVVWLQNEVTIPDTDILVGIFKTFLKIYILFDNDKTGVENAAILKTKLEIILNIEVLVIFIPNAIGKNVKDPSDLYYKSGRNSLKSFIEKEII
jgi:hypothetical protein